MNIEFTKIELASRIFLKWEYVQTDAGRVTKIKASADAVVHDDLADAIQGLAPHFTLLTEMKKKPEVAKIIDLKQISEDLTSKFKVTGLSIDDNKGELSYKISGYKILNTGKTVSFETPKIKREASEDDQYDFYNELEQQIEVIKDEVLEYMNGKEGISNQTSMDFGEEFDPNAEVENTEVSDFKETAA